MEITSKIEFKEYLIFMLNASIKNLLIMLIFGLGILYFLNYNNFDILLSIIMFVIFMFFILFFTYRNIKKFYTKSSFLKENVTYKFTKEMFYITGESFKSEINWKYIYKVIEKKNWFLVYHSSLVANLISKKNLTTDKILELKEILKSIPDLKLELK